MRHTPSALFLGLLILTAIPASAQENPFRPADVFDLEWASDVQISPDGEWVAYVRNGMSIMRDRREGNIWMVRSDGSQHYKLTSSDEPESSPRWSPDGSRIAFLTGSDDGQEIHVHWLEAGTTARLTQMERSPAGIAWSPSGEHIAFSMLVPGTLPGLDVKMPDKPRGAEWAEKPHVETRVNHESDGSGYIEPGFRHLFLVSAEGGAVRQVTYGDHHHGAPEWSADGESLYTTANPSEDWEYERRESDIFAVRVDNGSVTRLTDRFGPDSSPASGPDRIAYTGFDDREETFQNTQVYTMRPDGSGKALAAGGDLSYSNPTWADGDLYVQFDQEGITRVGRAERPLDIHVVASNLGGTSVGRPYGGGNFSLSGNGTIAWTYTTGGHVSDVAVADPGGENMRLVTDLNGDLPAELMPVEEIWTESSFDGRRIHSWIVYPPDFDPAQRYPLLVENHGGPISNYGDRFSAEMQLYASAGYVVLYPNPRGSTGYGQDFANLLYHAYPSQDYDDVMSAVDDVIARGYIDEDHLYVTGGSAGGVMTAWMVGKNHRFRAAVVAKPVVNWISKTLVADNWYGYYGYRYEGLPWEEPMNYWEFSPISLAGDIQTPTMVMVGTEDRRTPVSEARQLYHALKWRKQDTALVTIPGASHNIAGKPSQLIAKVLYTLAWFEKYGGPNRLP